ncbi:MAG: hypothetical protein QF898_06220 [SAR202 cluster bacterium]|nr:hypothetical protein [SAR202 cluster bacterium]MDP6514341.1 hypothetical protein [SAR202 cluster bacterium]MDP6714177.1 hypothetical protein [SAR202 cluster bacterium]
MECASDLPKGLRVSANSHVVNSRHPVIGPSKQNADPGAIP